MAEPVHKNEDDALKAVKNLHRGYNGVASKLLVAHIVSATIEILESAKSSKLRTEELRLRNAISGKDIHAEKRIVRGELTRIAAEIATKSETEIQKDIKSLEKIHEPIISASPDLIVQLADLKRSTKRGRVPRPTPTPPLTPPPLTPLPLTPPPLPPLPPHTPAVGPNIISNTYITINTLPHSESIRGTVQIGETLHLSKDGISWAPVAVDARGNFNIPITENSNGTYIYSLKTKNGAGLESGEESVTVVIAETLATAPTGPTITSPANFTVDTPTIEGSTTPGSEIELSISGRIVGAGTADATGNYSVTTSTLPDGPYVVTVRAINPADRSKTRQDTALITVHNIHNREVTATRAVEAAEPPHTPTQALHDAANRLVTALPTTSTVRPGLVTRLAAVQAAITALPRPLTSADLRSFTIPSLEVEQGTTNPKLQFNNLKGGTKITIFDKTGRNQISDEFEVPAGVTSEEIDLLTMSTEYPGDQGIVIKVEDVTGIQPAYIDRSKKIKVTHKKINLASTTPSLSFTSQMDTDGRVPFGSKIGIAINNIPKGAGLRITSPVSRLPGTTSYDLGNYRTDTGKFSGELDMIDTKKLPFNASEDLIIEMYDPNHPTAPAVAIRTVNFELAQKEAPLNLTTINPPTGKIKNGDPIIFGIGRPNRDTKIIVQPGGTEYDMSSSPADIRLPGTTTPGKHKYTFYLQDKNHPSKPAEPIGSHEIEVDHKELRLTAPGVPRIALIATQPSTKPTLNLTGLVVGSEVVITGPHGELAKFPVKHITATVSLNKLNIGDVGIQDIDVQVTDPHHTDIPPENSTFQIDVKKKVEAPKHLPQPNFKVPTDYHLGATDPEVELLNAITNSEVTITYQTAGGLTTTIPITVSADGNLKIPLIGFEDVVGASSIMVEYRNPVTRATTTRTIPMNIHARPPIEQPEGLEPEVDITTKPSTVKVGKLKPNQTINIVGGPGGGPVVATRGADGTYTIAIPANCPSTKQDYEITITDSISGATQVFPLLVNVKVAPKANLTMNHHNFIHGCEDAKRHSPGHFYINGATPPSVDIEYDGRWSKFYRLGTYPQYVVRYHGEKFSSSDPEKLFKEIKKHLDHHNDTEKNEYNAYWGLMPETPEHKKGDSHETGGKEGGKDKEGGHDKGGHSESHGEGGDHEHSLYDKSIGKIFGHGIIGKTFIGGKNLIPKWIRNSSKGISKSAIAGGAGGVAVAGGLMGASYLGLTGMGMVAASSFFWPAAIAIGGTTAAVKLYKWWKGEGESGGKSGGHIK